jgi:hypothetical protein
VSGFSGPRKLASVRAMRDRKASPDREHPYAHDAAATSSAQAAYFREQAARHRRDAERERLFAETTGGEAAREHAARADQHESWVSQAEAVAAALDGREGGRH